MSISKRATLICDSSKKHNIRSGIYYSVYHRTLIQKDNTITFTFDAGSVDTLWFDPPGQIYEDSGNGYWQYRLPPGTVTATGAIDSTVTPTSRAIIGAFFTYYYPSEGDYDTLFQNPTATVQYTGTKATPVGTCSYLGGYLEPTRDNQITFGTTKLNIDEQYVVTGGTLYYKLESASTYSSITFTGNACTIPAGTLQSAQYYDAYADLTCDDGMSCSVTLSDLNTHDTIGTVTAVSPVNTVVYGEGDFNWTYSNDSGAAQYAYDIQTSYDNGETWTIIENHVVTANTYAHVTGINAGSLLWRVRAYNQEDIASEWSNSLSIISNAAPEAPVIGNISGNGRITVSWSVQDQVAYEVKITANGETIYDSGVEYSTLRNHFVNQYLPNGDYEVGVRIFNAFGKASTYSIVSFSQVTGLNTLNASASADPGDQGVIINASMPNAVTYYLIRNGVLVAQFNGIYTDRFANGRIRYSVIGVDADDRFAQVDFEFEYIVGTNRLVLKDGTIFDINLRWNDPFATSQATEGRYYAAEYLGASVPEHIFAKMRVKRIEVAFYDTMGAEDLIGKTVFFADTYGNGYWCVPTSVNRSDAWFGNETTMSLEMTNGNEEIEYAH